MIKHKQLNEKVKPVKLLAWPLPRAVTERGRAGEPKEPGQTSCISEGSLFYEGSGLEQVVCELLQGAATCSNPAIPGPRVSKGNCHSAGDKDCTGWECQRWHRTLVVCKKRENKASRAVLFLDSKDVTLQGSYNHHKLRPHLDWDNMALGP